MQAAEPYAVVALPVELEGRTVDWQRWETPPHPSHIPLDCDSCDWQDGPRTAWGMVTIQPRRRGRQPYRLRRFVAFRCPRCQETRIYRIGAERLGEVTMVGDPRFVEVAYLPPNIEEDQDAQPVD